MDTTWKKEARTAKDDMAIDGNGRAERDGALMGWGSGHSKKLGKSPNYVYTNRNTDRNYSIFRVLDQEEHDIENYIPTKTPVTFKKQDWQLTRNQKAMLGNQLEVYDLYESLENINYIWLLRYETYFN